MMLLDTLVRQLTARLHRQSRLRQSPSRPLDEPMDQPLQDSILDKWVVLHVSDGDFATGFAVSVAIGDAGEPAALQVVGRLPAQPQIERYYEAWKQQHLSLAKLGYARLGQRNPSVVSHLSVQDYHQTAQALRSLLNEWLDARDFRAIRNALLAQLHPNERIRLLLQTSDPLIQQLPWHNWELLETYPRAELVLGARTYGPLAAKPTTPAVPSPANLALRSTLPSPPPRPKPLRILAILGDSNGIDISRDRQLLEALPHSQVTFLVEPQKQDLSDQLWDQDWDVLFFAGHSFTEGLGGEGNLVINPRQSIAIDDLRYPLRKTIERGLQLAIFNSCDGSGIARKLADLQIPQTIVMREPVPDRVAQAFLTHFLKAFSQGESLYLAMGIARQRLVELEDQFPYASWLPIIFQHPAADPLRWPQSPTVLQTLPWRQRLLRSGAIALVATAGLWGIRYLGGLERWELAAYDQFLQVRSLLQPEKADPRIVLIQITSKDISAQMERGEKLSGTSLSNASMLNLLKRLQSAKPRAIGLDLIGRDSKGISPGDQSWLAQQSNLIVACKQPDEDERSLPYAPATWAKPHTNMGFADAVKDGDGVLRRQIMAMGLEFFENTPCKATYPLNLQLALRYLQAEGVQIPKHPDEQLGQVVFPHLSDQFPGPYLREQRLGDLGNTQVMLNYRKLQFDTMSLEDVLNERMPADIVRDRVVLIGVDQQGEDRWLTPFGEVPGVVLQAETTSQIISAALGERRLIRVLPWWGDVLWVVGWSLVGSVVVLKGLPGLERGMALIVPSAVLSSLGDRLLAPGWGEWLVEQGMAILVPSVVLTGICYGAFLQGLWLPLVPGVLGVVLGSTVAIAGERARHSSKPS